MLHSPRTSPHPSGAIPAGLTNPGAVCAKEIKRMSVLVQGPGDGAPRASYVFFATSKRLSAMDISALASMKNVKKCDTWCELQNPVNHRVFERRLRPKPLSRGHVYLGITQRCPPRPSRWRGWKMASRELLASRLAQK
ncbi:hypothetical protein TorRG33x02_105210 [Trema orientale]|uniref:Uncharacterized protein n=1 Tax=Trema orientale TaxID=63057 RepID=A0A2P5F7N2_TREOI|nr:hypothetical protein TorRG33x02_105210 [Trema orientale]